MTNPMTLVEEETKRARAEGEAIERAVSDHIHAEDRAEIMRLERELESVTDSLTAESMNNARVAAELYKALKNSAEAFHDYDEHRYYRFANCTDWHCAEARAALEASGITL